MRTAIIEKLMKHMAVLPDRESDVVYALVQIRKLLEHAGEKRDLEILTFFCDWAVHVRLSGAGARHIVAILDERLGHYDRAQPESIDPDGKALLVFSFRLFWQQLREFCEREGLPDMWTRDHFAWHTVVRIYSEIVRDSRLEINRTDVPFRYLQKVVITACEPDPVVAAMAGTDCIGWNWELTLNDGKTINMPYTSAVV